jgi:DnaJ-class molecular chaperone
MKDPYETLGVARDASDKAIQSAYRKLAKLHHPDMNPGKPEAEARFKEISAANNLLSDAEKRGRYDRGEIDADGVEKPTPRSFYRDFDDAARAGRYQPESAPDMGLDEAGLEDLLARAFGQRNRANYAMRGDDLHFTLDVDFLDAAKGASPRLTLPDGRTIDVKIPPGLKDGQTLRLKGEGMPGFGGGPSGDGLVEVSVRPHRFFRREGDDIIIELPVTIKEARLGGGVHVPTIGGTVNLTIPPGSNSGTRLRLKGRGIAGGHQYVELQIVLPPTDEPELTDFLKSWQPKHAFDPRAKLEEK